MRRDLYNDLRVQRSIAPATLTADTDGAWVNVADVASITACVAMDNTADALAVALCWEAYVEKAQDDGAGAADGATAVSLTAAEYNTPATGLSTPASGAGICLVNAPAEDNQEYKVGLHELGATFEWVRIRVEEIGVHAAGNIMFAWFITAPQERPVTQP